MDSSVEGKNVGSKLRNTFRAFTCKFPGIAEAHEQYARVL
jgi:hypothetical protein